VDEAPTWPRSEQELIAVQAALAQAAEAASATRPWALPAMAALIAGCFVAYATGEAGPGHAGDRAWAAAVVWRPVEPAVVARNADRVLRRRGGDGPRQASDVVAQAVVGGRVAAPYTPTLLALREGPLLADAVGALDVRPNVLLVDATGFDHPRRAGLAIHLGRMADLPTVGLPAAR
jgi:deoxyribonuclease V